MVNEAEILTETADRLREVYPAATITIERDPRLNVDVVGIRAEGLQVIGYLTPFPKAAPRTYRLTIKGEGKGCYWTGALWPFRWTAVYAAIDGLLVQLQVRTEAERQVLARRQVYAPLLAKLRAKAQPHQRVTMVLQGQSEPTFIIVERFHTSKDLTERWAALSPRQKGHTVVHGSITFNGLTQAEAEKCLT
jgi:hypothetical protein